MGKKINDNTITKRTSPDGNDQLPLGAPGDSTDYVLLLSKLKEYVMEDVAEALDGEDLTVNSIAKTGFVSGTGGNGWKLYANGNGEVQDLYVRGNETVKGYVSSENFVSGAAGAGWKLNNDGTAEFESLYIRGAFSATEFRVRKITSQGGNLAITDAARISNVIEESDHYHCLIDTENGTIAVQLEVDDLVRCQIWDGPTAKYYTGIVVDKGAGWFDIEKPLLDGAGVPAAGDTVFRWGNVSTANRQGLIYLSSNDSSAPYMDVYDGIDGVSYSGKLKARLGKLSGITSPAHGALTGYGLYANRAYLENAYISGAITVGAGSNVYTQAETDNKVNNKSKNYTTTPTNYQTGDTWTLQSDTWVNGIVYKQGDVLTASAASASYNQAHWTKQIRYTDDSNLMVANENLLDDAGFERHLRTIDRESFHNLTRVSNESYKGFYSMKLEWTGDGNGSNTRIKLTDGTDVAPLLLGRPYIFFCYVKAEGSAIGRTINLYDYFPERPGGFIASQQSITLDGSWQRMEITGDAPSNASFYHVLFGAGYTYRTGDVIYIDCLFLGVGNRAPADWIPARSELMNISELNIAHGVIAPTTILLESQIKICTVSVRANTIYSFVVRGAKSGIGSGVQALNIAFIKIGVVNISDKFWFVENKVSTNYILTRTFDSDYDFDVYLKPFWEGNFDFEWITIVEGEMPLMNYAPSIGDIMDSVDNLEDYVDHAFKDGVIEAAEAKAIEKYTNIVNETYEQLVNSYNVLYNDALLTGSAKTNLASAKTNLDTSKNALLSAITNAIADGKTTSAEKAAVDSAYTDFKTKIGAYTTASDNAYKSITDALNVKATEAQSTANSKSTHYTSKPTSYKAGDTMTPFAAFTEGGKTFKMGVMYFTETTSATFNKDHWNEKLIYTDDTIANSRGKNTIGLTFPSSPLVDDLHFETSGRKWWKWNGTAWVDTGLGGLNYLYQALGMSTEITGGLTLTNIMGVRNESGNVTSYVNGLNGSNGIAFAAGVTNFAAYNEAQIFAIKHSGDIVIQKSGSKKLEFIASTGALTISGTVNATAGSIGGFTIESNKIKSATPAYGTPAFVLNKTDNKFEFYSGYQTDDGTQYGNIIPDITIKTGYGFGNSNYSGILAGVSCLGVYEDSIRRAATIGGRGITSDCSLVSFMPNKGGLGVESNTSILGRIVFSADQPLDSPFTFYDRRISAAIAGVTDLVQGAHGSRTYGGYFNSLFSGTLHTGVKVLENDSTHYFAGEFITTIYCTVSGGWLMFPEINHEEGRIIIIRNSSGGTVNLGRSSSENLSLGDNSSVTSTSIANKETQVWQRLNNRWRQILKQTF